MVTESKDILSLFTLKGKVALVTGGTRGIGKAIASGLASAGADIAVVSNKSSDEDVRKVVESYGRRFYYLKLDLSKREERISLVPQVVDHFGRLDILVNNAGIQRRCPAIDFPLEDWDKIINLMLTGVFELSQAAAKVMLKQGGGKIINMASLLSFQGGWTVPAYTVAKHGVAGLTKSLANEWASKNINVNAITPGYIDTEMNIALKNDPERGKAILSRIPAGRWGVPEDLTGAVIFLASNASDYVHGHILIVDGGWMGR